jgi:hypothetical protein
MGGGFAGCDLKIIGKCLSVIHCRRGYGVPMSKRVVGVEWGRRGNWWQGKERGKFLPVGNMRKQCKAWQNGVTIDTLANNQYRLTQFFRKH